MNREELRGSGSQAQAECNSQPNDAALGWGLWNFDVRASGGVWKDLWLLGGWLRVPAKQARSSSLSQHGAVAIARPRGGSLLPSLLPSQFSRCDGKHPHAGYEVGRAPQDVIGVTLSPIARSSHCRIWSQCGQRFAWERYFRLRARAWIAFSRCWPCLQSPRKISGRGWRTNFRCVLVHANGLHCAAGPLHRLCSAQRATASSPDIRLVSAPARVPGAYRKFRSAGGVAVLLG